MTDLDSFIAARKPLMSRTVGGATVSISGVEKVNDNTCAMADRLARAMAKAGVAGHVALDWGMVVLAGGAFRAYVKAWPSTRERDSYGRPAEPTAESKAAAARANAWLAQAYAHKGGTLARGGSLVWLGDAWDWRD